MAAPTEATGGRPSFTRARSRRMTTSGSVGDGAASRVSVMLLGNDSWELFEGIPQHYSLRTRVRMKMQLSTLGYAWEICQTLFALVASALYVLQTYEPNFDTDAFDLAALIVFSVDYALNLYAAESRLRFFVSFMSLMDIITILPSLIDRITRHNTSSGTTVGNAFPFLRFIRVLRLLRLTRLIRAAGSRSSSAVQKQIHTIVVLITCIVFISAGVFHAVESANRGPGIPLITFGDSLYFLMVTMATVGYGDIAPLTMYGKAVAAAVIIISFTIIPTEISRLTQLMGLQSQFRRFYHPSVGNPHVLVVGHIFDAHVLLDFFKEFYHPDRESAHTGDAASAAAEPLTGSPCVLMGPDEPSEAIVNLLDHPLLQNRVTYIKGSVMSEEDLCRVGADAARACFVLVPKSSDTLHKTDAETVLRLLAIRNYNTDLEIYTQMISTAYSDYISEVDADHVLCINEIKLSLMAKSCLCPGLVTLVSNMFRSSSISSSATRSYVGWQKEYVEGVAMEVYATKLPPQFHGLSFAQACEILYKCFHGEVIMMGVLESSSNTVRRHVSRAAVPAAESGVQLPSLKTQSVRPIPSMPSPSSRDDTDAETSQMYINPGHDVCMRAGQTVYILSESKRLTLTASILQHLYHWLNEGNELPSPVETCATEPVREEQGLPVDHDHIETRLDTSAKRQRTQGEVLLEEAVHPLSGRAIENHIIVVTDLDHVAMKTFVRLLRLRRHVPGRSDYHTILFLSWASETKVAGACRVLQAYDDVFLMMARDSHSRTEFFRANILRAARCVLLSDRSSSTQLDGETIDSQTIFHYLAILSIQSEFGVDTTSGLMPVVELSIPRTMKILDSALIKRTLRSFIHRQKINAFLRHASGGDLDKKSSVKLRGRPWAKKLVPHLVRQGTDDFSSLKSSIMLRKSLQTRHSSIRQEDATTNRSASFDATGTAMLPFFAAGYGFSDDVFDNMLCQSYFTPGLVRFIYALIFTENGRAYNRQRSTLTSSGRSEAVYSTGIGDLGVDDDDDDDEDVDDEESDDETEKIRASSVAQVPVPLEFVSCTFGELFLHLIATEQVVAIALYRGRGTPFSLPYVATGPSVETVLMRDDLVFVLAQPDALEHLDPPLKAQDATTATALS